MVLLSIKKAISIYLQVFLIYENNRKKIFSECRFNTEFIELGEYNYFMRAKYSIQRVQKIR
jgi:hypothetical protein